jgi:hypothetical protein
MNAVIDPEPAPIRDQSLLAQLGQIARDMRLHRASGVGQLTDAELAVAQEQQQAAQARVVGQGGKELSWA